MGLRLSTVWSCLKKSIVLKKVLPMLNNIILPDVA